MASQRETRQVLWPSGTVLATVEYLDGVMEGVSRSFSMTGELRQECHFKGGKLHGSYKIWWENGNLKELGQYHSGSKAGRWEWFDRDGAPVRAVDFSSAL
jgi:antitoxin component YwqK of YwqJK toxin-antitoxin module